MSRDPRGSTQERRKERKNGQKWWSLQSVEMSEEGEIKQSEMFR